MGSRCVGRLAIAVSAALAPYLPVPKVEKTDDGYRIVRCAEKSIGTTRGFLGNSGVVVRAYSYIRSLGEAGLLRVSENAVL